MASILLIRCVMTNAGVMVDAGTMVVVVSLIENLILVVCLSVIISSEFRETVNIYRQNNPGIPISSSDNAFRVYNLLWGVLHHYYM